MILITFVWLLKKEGGIVMKNLVVLTGAGMSAESGISTFRDAGGLWDKYPVEQVATPEGYQRDPALVINFYNERRKQLLEVKPNRGHELLAELEKSFHVTVVTQNVDNLHERAGSSHIIHLHGELTKVCSSRDPYNPQFIKELKPEAGEAKHSKDPPHLDRLPFYRKTGDLARGRRIFVYLYKKQGGICQKSGE